MDIFRSVLKSLDLGLSELRALNLVLLLALQVRLDLRSYSIAAKARFLHE